jgi:hypothetical protein
VNPPLRHPGEAPEGPPAFGAEPAPPAPVAVGEDDQGVEPPDEPDEPPRPETDSEGRPLPVHIPYARTASDPDVVVAPPAAAPSAPRPARSPFWAAVRSHVWLVVIVLVVLGVAGTAYWGLRVHQRIEAGTLERAIAGREGASAVRCVEQQPNGAVWACGLVYKAASVCLIANVNPVGDWTTNDGADRCSDRPELTAILPDHITAAAVLADMESLRAFPGGGCAKVPTRKVRWACLSRPAAGGDCQLVRVAAWTSLATEQSDVCDHMPVFRKHHRKQ